MGKKIQQTKTAGKTAKKSGPLDNMPVGKHELAPGVSLEIREEKKDRVVLALSTEDAELVKTAIEGEIASFTGDNDKRTTLAKISERIQKTLNKQKVLREFEKQGIKPTKELIQKAVEVATIK